MPSLIILIIMLIIAIGLSFIIPLNAWVIIVFMVMFAVGLNFYIPLAEDLYLKLFGKKVNATALNYQISETSVNPYETFYYLTMQYQFDYQGKTYTSNNVTLQKYLIKKDQQKLFNMMPNKGQVIPIFVAKNNPNFNAYLLFQSHPAVIFLALFLGTFLPILIAYLIVNKLTIFDVFMPILQKLF